MTRSTTDQQETKPQVDIHEQGDTPPPQRARRHSPEEDAEILSFARDAAVLVSDLHCEDVLLLDVRGLSDMMDYVLLATGTSDRQIRSVASSLEDLAEERQMSRIGREVDGNSTWLVADFVDVVVHFFDTSTRAFYHLESLWGDAPKVEWKQQDRAKQS